MGRWDFYVYYWYWRMSIEKLFAGGARIKILCCECCIECSMARNEYELANLWFQCSWLPRMAVKFLVAGGLEFLGDLSFVFLRCIQEISWFYMILLDAGMKFLVSIFKNG